MRFAVPLALLFLVACEPPARLPVAPDLRLLSTSETGELVSFRDGATISIEALDASCFRKRTLRIQNIGSLQAHIRVSTTSTQMEVLTAPESLAVDEEAAIELQFSPIESGIGPFEAPLTIEIDGEEPINFVLTALVLVANWDVERWIDFGGVEVGDTRFYGDGRITGIAGDFSEEPLRFSPRSLGPQRVEARYTGLLHCPFVSQVTLLGDGVASVLTGPSEVDFGDVAVGSSAERDVVVTNYSRDFLTTQLNAPFTVTRDNSLDVSSRGPNLVLVPATPTMRVRFSPSAIGVVNQDLTVSAGMKTLTISIRGNGVP